MLSQDNAIQAPAGVISGLDKPVSRLFLGTASPKIMAGEDADALFDAALSLGVNAFDCARSYGRAEEVLGRWIRRRGNREALVLLTKCGDVNQGRVHVDGQVIREQLARSLETLGVDCVDIFLLHRDDPATPVAETIDTLNACADAGKIRLFGVSNWTHARIAEANDYARRHGLRGFSVSSPNYGLARQVRDLWGGGCVTISGPENRDARAWYAEARMPVIAYSSMGRGFFSGRFAAFDEEGARRALDEPAQRGYLCPENMRRLRNAEALARELNTTVADVAMRYLFSGDMDVYAVVSTTSPDRLAGNAASAAHPLTREQVEFLERDEGEE